MGDNHKVFRPCPSAEARQHPIREIIYQIRRLMQTGYLYTKELNKTYHVSVPQLNCILALHEHGPLPLSHIARLITVKSGTITGIIDRLEEKDLVKRVRSSPDRRIITIELTETGKALAENAPPPIQKKIVDGLERLPPERVEQIVESLSLLTNMLDIDDLEIE